MLWYAQVEQFHTVVKGLARGPRNIMASIRNQYLRLVTSNFTRLTTEIDWVVKARKSTAAAFLSRAESADKKDLFAEPRGKGKPKTLKASDLCMLQELWGRLVPEYGELLERCNTAQKGISRARRVSIAVWSPRSLPYLTDKQKKWQKMDGEITVRVHSNASV
jgi:hypothetical protein